MHTEGEEIHVSDTEASGASKEGVVRWVLIASTLLAIVLLSLIWIIPAMTQGDIEEEASVSNKIQSSDTDRDQIDSIPEADTFGDTPVAEDADPSNAATGSDTPLETIEN